MSESYKYKMNKCLESYKW